MSATLIAAGVTAMFIGVVGLAKTAGHWDGAAPEQIFFELIPNAASYAHPR